jgi:nitroreductase
LLIDLKTMIKFQKPRQATAFDIHPLIADRYSPRAFSDSPITEQELGSLFEAARWAPSSINEQPWRFIYARKGENAFAEMVNGLSDGNKPWAKNAPVLLIALVKNEFSRGGVNIAASHDLGLAVGNMSLQAQHLNIGIHQMGGISREYLTHAF